MDYERLRRRAAQAFADHVVTRDPQPKVVTADAIRRLFMQLPHHDDNLVVLLPPDVLPEVTEIDGYEVKHSAACPEGQALVMNPDLAERKLQLLLEEPLREHWA